MSGDKGRAKKSMIILRVLPLIAVGLILSAVVLGVLLFVVGIPLPGRQPPGPEEPPTVTFTWVAPDNLPTNRVVVTPDDLRDYPDVLSSVRADGNGSQVLSQARYDALERYLNSLCQQTVGGPCISVLSDGGQFYIILLV